MRKLAVILVVLLLLGLRSTAQAADLQEGWYVKASGLSVYYEGSFDPYAAGLGFEEGMYGPFAVSKPLGMWEWAVSVPSTVAGVAPGTNVAAQERIWWIDELVTRATFSYQTNYDSNQMRLELVRTDAQDNLIEVIWLQELSGFQSGSYDSYWREYVRNENERLALRVVAVPEPATWVGILIPGFCLLHWRRR